MPLDQPLFVPTLVNNTNPLDFIIYTYESANPGSAIASAFWGSVAQAFILGVILISASKCYWTYVGADGWLNITIVTVLLMVTIADFIHHQYAVYGILSHTNPITGSGIANAYRSYWNDAFLEGFMVAVTHPLILGYFIGRCYGLWGQKRIILYVGAVATVILTVQGLVACTYGFAVVRWKDGIPDTFFVIRNLDLLLGDATRAYRLMATWLLTSTIVEFILTCALLAAMYKHQRTAESMRNMEGVRSTLKRGMLFIIESMALILANQLAQAIIFLSGLGLSRCLRAVSCLRVPLGTFAVIWSLNCRAELKDMLQSQTSNGPISFDASGSFGQRRPGTRGSSNKENKSGSDDHMELGTYGSTQNLVKVDTSSQLESAPKSLEFSPRSSERDRGEELMDSEKLRIYGRHFGAKQ